MLDRLSLTMPVLIVREVTKGISVGHRHQLHWQRDILARSPSEAGKRANFSTGTNIPRAQ